VVVTRANNRETIEANLPSELAERIRFIYYDLPERLGAFKRAERGLYPYYLMWQWGAYRLARRAIVQTPVDYAIHLTFGSVWMPTFMHRLPVPFIWGPIGGGEAVPWALIRSLPVRARMLQYVRYLLMATVSVNPLVAGVARRARVILARTSDTANMFPARYRAKVRLILETAAADDWFDRVARSGRPAADGPLQVIYTGRLIALKNLDMAVRAVAIARRRGADIRFTLVGDGPLQSALEGRASAEGIADAVTFTGRCTQDEVLDRLGQSDLYLFPSLKEGGVWSLMEAMAVGLPSICVNTSGMAVIADPTCARMIEPDLPDKMLEAFADALCSLATDPEGRREMGRRARNRIETEFRWTQKGTFMEMLFEHLETEA
jgi:glycosyltransferase involved in cell wall biosynthesis